MKKKVYRVRTQYIFDGVFDVVAESKEDARQKVLQNCRLVMGGSIHSTLPDEKKQLDFLHTPRSKDGTDNHFRKTNRVMRSADCRLLPSFVSFERTKKVAKKPDEKHLVIFDSELRRLKSNKKPIISFS